MTVIEHLTNKASSYLPYYSNLYTIVFCDKNNDKMFARFSSCGTIPECLKKLEVEWGPIINYITEEIAIGV